MSLHQAQDSSVNLQIRILLVLCLLVMTGLLLARFVQSATLNMRMEALTEKLVEQQRTIDQLRGGFSPALSNAAPGASTVAAPDQAAMIAQLQEELAALRAGGASSAAGMPSAPGGAPAPGLPPGLAGSNTAPSGVAPGLPPASLPGTLSGNDAFGDLPPAPDSLPDPLPEPPAPEDPLVKKWKEQQAVAMVETVNAESNLIVLQPVEGIQLVENDQVLVGRDGVGPVGIFMITRVEASGLAIADKMSDQESLAGDNVRQGDMAVIY